MWNRRHRWIRRFAAGLAFAALAVPTAQAGIVEDTGIGSSGGQQDAEYNGYGYQQSPGVPVDGQNAEYNGYGYQQSPGVPVDGQNVAVRPDDRGVRVAPGNSQIDVAVRPDDRGVRITPQPSSPQVVVSARPDDRADRFTPEAGNPQVIVAAPSTGFDWSDAGIGAGSALGLMLLALGAALATRHVGRKSLAGA
jgi:hypothetical protein